MFFHGLDLKETWGLEASLSTLKNGLTLVLKCLLSCSFSYNTRPDRNNGCIKIHQKEQVCVFSSVMSGHYKRRRKEYVPEEKYDVDGRLVKNELYNKQIWDLKAIVNTLYINIYI